MILPLLLYECEIWSVTLMKKHRLIFMFMGPCILVYNDHISNQWDAAFYALYLMVIPYMFRASLAHHQEFRKLCVQCTPPSGTQAHTNPRLTKHVSTIHVSLPFTRTHNTQKSNIPLQQFTDTARGQPRDRINNKWIRLLKVSYPKRGTTTQNTAHSFNDLDTPVHTGTQLEKSSPSPESTKIRMNYN